MDKSTIDISSLVRQVMYIFKYRLLISSPLICTYFRGLKFTVAFGVLEFVLILFNLCMRFNRCFMAIVQNVTKNRDL